MPIDSYTQIQGSEQFKGLPESGKRLVVAIINLLEEQGITGEAAVGKAKTMLQSLFNPGADGMWTNKVAADFGSAALAANMLGAVPGPVGTIGRKAGSMLTLADTANGAASTAVENYHKGKELPSGNTVIPKGVR